MKVTLEQIDELRNRVNVSYEEAKSTLEKNDGDLIKSIIELEKKKGRRNEKHHDGFTSMANRLLSLKMSIKSKDGDTLLNVPLVIVIAVFGMAFWAVIFILALAILNSCKIKVYRDKSLNVNDLKKNVQETVDKIKVKSEEIFNDDSEVKAENAGKEEETENEIIIE
jgi:NACalpha-BTF3-like transcription factor